MRGALRRVPSASNGGQLHNMERGRGARHARMAALLRSYRKARVRLRPGLLGSAVSYGLCAASTCRSSPAVTVLDPERRKAWRASAQVIEGDALATVGLGETFLRSLPRARNTV